MKLNVQQVLKDLQGEPLKDPKGAESTLRWVCVEALLANFEDERSLSGEEKVKRYELAKRISKEDVVEVSVEEAALLKQLIGKGFVPIVVGQAYSLIG